MKNLEEIRERCVITEDEHWLWRDALRPDGRPNIWAPDYTRGGMQTQSGPRAVWHCSTGLPISAKWRAYGTCSEPTCCNPAHVRCTSETDFGKWLKRTGAYKNQTRRILANRATSRARTKVTAEIILEIQQSPETGRALSARLGLLPTVVSRARRGEFKAFLPSGMFSGLGARA